MSAMPHVFSFDPIYDGRCVFCDCRAGGRHADEPCAAQEDDDA